MAGYAKIPHDWVEQCSALSDAEKGRLFVALLEYDRTGEVPELEGNERFVFPALKAQMDSEAERTNEISAKRSSARKNKTQQTTTNNNKQEQNTTNDNNGSAREKERTKEKENTTPLYISPKGDTYCPPKGGKRFHAPTVDEVRAYCQQRGNGVDAQTFVDFYASKGWKVGNQPMKDWQAAVRTWERNKAYNGKSRDKHSKFVQYAQHTDSDFSLDDIDVLMREMAV